MSDAKPGAATFERPARPRGMVDLLPADMGPWHALEAALRRAMAAYGYAELRTPLVERTALFERSIGEATDIVEKEMYTFEDRKGERLSLRPENTAGCVRAALDGALLQAAGPTRIWYLGPMFRYERPQLGRQRQFHQAGAEVYGAPGADVECELILLSARLWRELGIESAVSLEINTLGTSDDRARWTDALVAYFGAHESALDDDSRRRLTKNPLRILDTKNPDMQALVAAAPKLDAVLSDASREHFERVRALLRGAGIDARVNPRLVRGLDYYSHTVFEWVTDRLGAQSAVCAGGRYDALVEQMGGKGGTGVGWAMGLERIVALMAALGLAPPVAVPEVFLTCTDDVPAGDAIALAESVRAGARSVVQDFGGGSMKSRFKRADRSGARVALVVGADELAAGEVTMKSLRRTDERGEATGGGGTGGGARRGADGPDARGGPNQRRVSRAALADALADMLADI